MANTKYNPANAGRSDFDRLFSAADDTAELVAEVHTARGTSSSLDDRLDASDEKILDIQTDILTNIKPDIEGLEEGVETAEAGIARLTDKTAKNLLNTVYLAGMQALNTVGLWSTNAYTIDGLTFTVALDGTITVTGTHDTVNTVFFLPVPTLAAGTYAISGCPADGSSMRYCLRLKDGITEQYVNDYGEGEVFPIATTQPLSVEIKIAREYNSTVNLTFKPMVCLRDEFEQSDKYVPYCKTPQETYIDILELSRDLSDETTARTASDTKQNAALTSLIDGGAKNRLPITLADLQSKNTAGSWSGNVYTRRGISFTVNADMTISVSGTNDGTGDSWLDLYGTGTTTDFVGLVCSGCPSDGSSTTYGIQCGNNNYDYGTPSGRVCVQGAIAIVVRSGYDAASGLTFKPMICEKSAMDVSSEYEQYCPTIPELYQMILALQSGSRSIEPAPENSGEEER